MKSCPFWRIVVVWKGSGESLREWTRKARLEVYEDPAYAQVGVLLVNRSLLELLELAEESAYARADGEGFDFQWHLAVARPEKKGDSQHLKMPPAVDVLRRHLEDPARPKGPAYWERFKMRAGLRFLAVMCFVRVHGIGGLERWVLARLSPRRWVAHLAMRRRVFRLYRASRSRHSGRYRRVSG